MVRRDNESTNDRNDRAIRQVCQYYDSHSGGRVRAVLLTDDKENLGRAREEGLAAATCREYVASLDRPELLDRIAAREERAAADAEIDERQVTDLARKTKSIIFPEHKRLSEVQSGLKMGMI